MSPGDPVADVADQSHLKMILQPVAKLFVCLPCPFFEVIIWSFQTTTYLILLPQLVLPFWCQEVHWYEDDEEYNPSSKKQYQPAQDNIQLLSPSESFFRRTYT
jgi:hypothetical protein